MVKEAKRSHGGAATVITVTWGELTPPLVHTGTAELTSDRLQH